MLRVCAGAASRALQQPAALRASSSCVSKVAAAGFSSDSAAESQTVAQRIQTAIDADPVVLFQKGTPDAPQCGFSWAVVQILTAEGAAFRAYNVLADEQLRQGIKEFSNWPTIPQVYVRGEFVGGCDIIKSMHENGELRTLLREKDALVSDEPLTLS